MGNMIKKDFIAKYGEEAWENELIKRNERNRKWREKNKDKVKEERKRYNESHKEKLKEREKNRHRNRSGWYSKNKDAYNRKNKLKRDKNTNKNYRATMLLGTYKKRDREHNRGDCTITQKWILENIFTSSCVYCGETDWRKLGCDRIDNSKPHTPENCVCSCWDCNNKRKNKNWRGYSPLQ